VRSFFNPVHTVGVAGASSTNKASGAPKSLGDGEGKRKLPEPSSKDDDTSSPEKQARTKGSSARSQGASDDLGALLHTWRVEDARPALEANGFTSVQRMRDELEADDLPELGLSLATRKILARLLKHWADEKRAERVVRAGYQNPTKAKWTSMAADEILADIKARGVPRARWPTNASHLHAGAAVDKRRDSYVAKLWGPACVEFHLPTINIGKAAEVFALMQKERI